jgi:hypothetical protein
VENLGMSKFMEQIVQAGEVTWRSSFERRCLPCAYSPAWRMDGADGLCLVSHRVTSCVLPKILRVYTLKLWNGQTMLKRSHHDYHAPFNAGSGWIWMDLDHLKRGVCTSSF